MYELGVIGTKHVPEELMLNDLSSMFEMGTVTLTTAKPPSIEMPGLCPAK
jgi:hypothetical protein